MMATSAPWPGNSLMAALSEPEREALLSVGSRVGLRRGSSMIRQGEPGEMLYVLLSGYVKVTVSADDGNEIILALRGRGDVVGEFAVIDGKPRTASVSALESVAAARIGKLPFLAFCAQYPAANGKLMRTLTEKLRMATDRRAAARFLDPGARLARTLSELAAQHGTPSPEGVVIPLPLTQADLGALAVVAQSTVERILRDFREEGIVQSQYRRTVVLDMAALQRRASIADETG
jgi:CRP/FNR family transcriptional regulator, cyclic AMP receptor protein